MECVRISASSEPTIRKTQTTLAAAAAHPYTPPPTEHLLCCNRTVHKAFILKLFIKNFSQVWGAYICNSTIWETEAGVQSRFLLHTEFTVSRSYMDPVSKSEFVHWNSSHNYNLMWKQTISIKVKKNRMKIKKKKKNTNIYTHVMCLNNFKFKINTKENVWADTCD